MGRHWGFQDQHLAIARTNAMSSWWVEDCLLSKANSHGRLQEAKMGVGSSADCKMPHDLHLQRTLDVSLCCDCEKLCQVFARTTRFSQLSEQSKVHEERLGNILRVGGLILYHVQPLMAPLSVRMNLAQVPIANIV